MMVLMCKIEPGHGAMTQPPEYASYAAEKPAENPTSNLHF